MTYCKKCQGPLYSFANGRCVDCDIRRRSGRLWLAVLGPIIAGAAVLVLSSAFGPRGCCTGVVGGGDVVLSGTEQYMKPKAKPPVVMQNPATPAAMETK